MTQTLQDKQQIVSDLSEVAKQAHSAIAADYNYLTVTEMTELRVKAKEQNVYVRVVKNTLARRALQGSDYQCMCDSFKGPLLLAFSQEEPGAAARLFRDFIKEHKQLKVTMLAANGQLMEPSALMTLANLPTHEEALAMLLGLMKAPITQLVGTLMAVPSKLVRTLAAVQQSKAANETS